MKKHIKPALLIIFLITGIFSLESCVVGQPSAVVVKPAPAIVVAPYRPVGRKVVVVRPYRSHRHRNTVIIR